MKNILWLLFTLAFPIIRDYFVKRDRKKQRSMGTQSVPAMTPEQCSRLASVPKTLSRDPNRHFWVAHCHHADGLCLKCWHEQRHGGIRDACHLDLDKYRARLRRNETSCVDQRGRNKSREVDKNPSKACSRRSYRFRCSSFPS